MSVILEDASIVVSGQSTGHDNTAQHPTLLGNTTLYLRGVKAVTVVTTPACHAVNVPSQKEVDPIRSLPPDVPEKYS